MKRAVRTERRGNRRTAECRTLPKSGTRVPPSSQQKPNFVSSESESRDPPLMPVAQKRLPLIGDRKKIRLFRETSKGNLRKSPSSLRNYHGEVGLFAQEALAGRPGRNGGGPDQKPIRAAEESSSSRHVSTRRAAGGPLSLFLRVRDLGRCTSCELPPSPSYRDEMSE